MTKKKYSSCARNGTAGSCGSLCHCKPVKVLAIIGKNPLFIFVAHYLVLFFPLYITGLLNKCDRPMAIVLSGFLILIIIRMATWRQTNRGFTVYGIMDQIFQTVSIKTTDFARKLLFTQKPHIPSNTSNWPKLAERYLCDKAGAEHGISEG